MIEPTDADIGRTVLYTGNRFVGGKVERGEIRGFNHWTVFVRYGADAVAKATSREDLEWENMSKPGQFRVITAIETLAAGEADAMHKMLEAAIFMEGFARGADARFAAIEARLKALEDAARPGVAMPSGARLGEAGLCDAPHGEDIEK